MSVVKLADDTHPFKPMAEGNAHRGVMKGKQYFDERIESVCRAAVEGSLRFGTSSDRCCSSFGRAVQEFAQRMCKAFVRPNADYPD